MEKYYDNRSLFLPIRQFEDAKKLREMNLRISSTIKIDEEIPIAYFQ